MYCVHFEQDSDNVCASVSSAMYGTDTSESDKVCKKYI